MSFIRPFKSSFLAPKPRDNTEPPTDSTPSPFQSASSFLAVPNEDERDNLNESDIESFSQSFFDDVNKSSSALKPQEDRDLAKDLTPSPFQSASSFLTHVQQEVPNEGERDHLNESDVESFSQSFFDDVNTSSLALKLQDNHDLAMDSTPSPSKSATAFPTNAQKEAVSEEKGKDDLNEPGSQSFSQSSFDEVNKNQGPTMAPMPRDNHDLATDLTPSSTKSTSSSPTRGQEEAVSNEDKGDYLNKSDIESISKSLDGAKSSLAPKPPNNPHLATDSAPRPSQSASSSPTPVQKEVVSNEDKSEDINESDSVALETLPPDVLKDTYRAKERKIRKKRMRVKDRLYNVKKSAPSLSQSASSLPTPVQKEAVSNENKREDINESDSVALETFPPDVLEDIYRAKEQKIRKKRMRVQDRLYNFKKIRSAGIYVECCDSSCKKWRYLPDVKDPSSIPEHWICSMNPDPKFNSCEIAQEEFVDGDDMVETSYSLGSVVWAKLRGFPWWPAFVDDDPDTSDFFWTNDFSRVPTWYHVVFFDRLDKVVSRAWIRAKDLRRYERASHDDLKASYDGWTSSMESNVRKAMTRADAALRMELQKRRDKYCFYKGAEGKWGLPWHLDLNST